MRGEDAGGLRVPGPGDGERTVPDPWRDQHRAAHRRAGFANLAAARTTSGDYSAASWAEATGTHRTMAVRLLLLVSRKAAASISAARPGGAASRRCRRNWAHASALPANPGSGNHDKDPEKLRELDARGRCAARARAAPRGRAAELAAARTDRAALVPWRAAIAAAKLARREALAARRVAQIENHDKDRMERLPGACLGGRAVGGAAEVGGAGTAPGVALAGQVRGPGDGRALPVGCGAAGGGHGVGKIAQRPSGRAPEGVPDETGAGGGMGAGEGGVGVSTLALEASRLDGCVAEGVPALARSENGDKDPVDRPPVRWPWDGVKGRLCGTTISGGYQLGVTEPGTWQAVLEASNAVEAGKSWTLLGSRLRWAGGTPGGWPDLGVCAQRPSGWRDQLGVDGGSLPRRRPGSRPGHDGGASSGCGQAFAKRATTLGCPRVCRKQRLVACERAGPTGGHGRRVEARP